eukprot:gene49216-20533_t
MLPLAVGIGATTSPVDQWRDGYFAEVATQIGGGWLQGWIVAAAAVSNIG